jgi:hypothetical protein
MGEGNRSVGGVGKENKDDGFLIVEIECSNTSAKFAEITLHLSSRPVFLLIFTW